MIKSVRKRENKSVEIQVTNLVDIIFVLLIFFVLTTTFTKDTGIEITKPKASSAAQLSAQNMQIVIGRSGQMYIEDRQVDLALIQSMLRRALIKNPDMPVVLVTDKRVDMGTVLSVMDMCNIAGVKKTSVQAEKL